MKTTKYKGIGYKGVIGDFATEYWTEKDWENHRQSINKLKSEGEYMKPYEFTLELVDDPLYDVPLNKQVCESYRMDIIDLSKVNLKDIKPFKTPKEHLDAWKDFDPNKDSYQN